MILGFKCHDNRIQKTKVVFLDVLHILTIFWHKVRSLVLHPKDTHLWTCCFCHCGSSQKDQRTMFPRSSSQELCHDSIQHWTPVLPFKVHGEGNLLQTIYTFPFLFTWTVQMTPSPLLWFASQCVDDTSRRSPPIYGFDDTLLVLSLPIHMVLLFLLRLTIGPDDAPRPLPS